MSVKRPLSSQELSVEERTGEMVIVFPRDARPAIKILRERMIINAQGERIAQTQNYVLGRWLADEVANETVELAGKQLTVAEVIEALGKLADRWADEDIPIYGQANYLQPIT